MSGVTPQGDFAPEEEPHELEAEPTKIVPDPQPEPDPEPIPDARLYVPEQEEWHVHIKRDSEKIYCYAKLPGEDWFHMLLNGEIYVSRQHEKYCLRCALRHGYLTEDRLFWQHRVPQHRKRVL
ncbi:MAG TPA: hypothetical protein VGM98_01205 [Schlesneria sp.]|jgi:hypothetical protein